MTLLELMNYWVDNYARVHCKKWQAFNREFELYVSPLSLQRLEEIKRGDVVTLQSKLMNEKGKSAANAAVTLISMLYNKAIDWELFEGKNPASRIRKFRIEPRDRFLQPDELPRFLESVSKLKNATTRDLFLMLLLGGQRRRNTSNMRWDEIDFERKVWQIKGENSKNGKSHTVPLVEQAIQILLRRRHVHPEWVFPREDGSGPVWYRCTAWNAVLKRAGITNLRMHDLRRSLASYQAITGASLPIIAKTLNHLDTKSTQIYARLNIEPVRDSMTMAVDSMLTKSDESVVGPLLAGSQASTALLTKRLTKIDSIIAEGKILACIRSGFCTLNEIYQASQIRRKEADKILGSLVKRNLIETFEPGTEDSTKRYRIKGYGRVSNIVDQALASRIESHILKSIDQGRGVRKYFWWKLSRNTRISAIEMNKVLMELEQRKVIESYPIRAGSKCVAYRRMVS